MDEKRNREAGPLTAERRAPSGPGAVPASMRPQPGQPELIVREGREADMQKRSSGVRDVVGGCVLIGIGFVWGSSVFLGNPTALDWVFDGLGTFWLCKGLFGILTA